MKNKTKKILCMLVVVCILATMFVGLSVSVQAATSVSVSTFTQLEAAVNDPDVDIIIIKENISLNYPLYISRSIKLIATRSKTLFSLFGERHFCVEASNVVISFNNVVLDGNDYGGGIEIGYMDLNPVGIHNVTIENPYIQNCRYSYYKGSAIGIRRFESSGITIMGGTFENNTGAAIYSESFLEIYGVVFYNNIGYIDNGGAIYSKNDLNIYTCVFENNTTDYHGGAIYSEGELYISGSEFYDNTCGYSGGAIYNNLNTLQITDTIFDGNNSLSDGGAVYSNGDTYIDNCTISNNTSFEGAGGAVFFSKIPNTYWGALFLNTCNINNNTSELDGGAIYYDGEYNPNMFSVSNTTFSDNYSEAGGYYMYLPTDITAYNSVTWNVTASSPFYYAFNNYDISYTNGILVP